MLAIRLRILTRYVLFDLLKVFLITLAGMTTLLLVAIIGKEAVEEGLGLGPLLRIIPYLLPEAMQFAIPGTMLLAATSVYGRMAAFNEVVALKSMGISPWVLTWPTLVLAGLVSFSAVALNDLAYSWGRLGRDRVIAESIEEIAYGQLRVKQNFRMGKFDVSIRRLEGQRLIQPTVTIHESDAEESLTIWADWAEPEFLPDRGEVVIRFSNADFSGPVDVVIPELEEVRLPIDDLLGRSSSDRRPSTYALAEISEAKVKQQAKVEALREDMSAQAAFALMTGEFEQLSTDNWQPLEQDVNSAAYTMHRLNTTPYRRWANGFSCLAFVMVGVPVALLLKKAEFLASFFSCFGPILIVYYPLLIVSVNKAKGGALPPQAVWIGNLVLIVVGLWLMRRVVRY